MRRCWAILLLLLPADIPRTQEGGKTAVVVSGMTYQLGDDGKHSPLAGVRVQVSRGRATLLRKPVETKADGSFRFSVPQGSPFLVTFYAGDDRVPELQQLAGLGGAVNVAHVVLLTPDQYEKLEKQGAVSPPLAEKLRCALAQAPAESELAAQLRKMIEKLPRR